MSVWRRSLVPIKREKIPRVTCSYRLEFGLWRQWLGDRGYDPVYGARPLKRFIQRWLQNPLASLMLEGRVQSGETVCVSIDAKELVINGEENLTIAAK